MRMIHFHHFKMVMDIPFVACSSVCCLTKGFSYDWFVVKNEIDLRYTVATTTLVQKLVRVANSLHQGCKTSILLHGVLVFLFLH